VTCTPGSPVSVNIDLQPLIDDRISNSLVAQPHLVSLARASGGE
jgi:hypothetical protein